MSSFRLRPGFFFATLFFLLLAVSFVRLRLLQSERDLARLETQALDQENRALRQQLEAERIFAAALAKRVAPPPAAQPPPLSSASSPVP